MAFDNTPNRLESAFIQRNNTNLYYEQVNVSGSDLIVYHDSDGKLTADKVLVWAALYGIGSGGATFNITASNLSASNRIVSNVITASVVSSSNYIFGGTFTGSTAPVTLQGYVSVTVSGSKFWMPYYSSP